MQRKQVCEISVKRTSIFYIYFTSMYLTINESDCCLNCNQNTIIIITFLLKSEEE